MSFPIVTFEDFEERDQRFIAEATEVFGTPFVRRPAPDGDERVLLLEHHSLELAELSAMPDLQTILLFSNGHALVPINQIEGRSIALRRVVNLSGLGVAEHVMALILGLKKRLIESHQAVIDSVWRPGIDGPLYTNQRAHEFNWSGIDDLGWLYGQTIGIIGFGRIGKAIAQRAQAFGMNVLYYKRARLSEHMEHALQVQYAPLDDLLGLSDVVTLNLPFSESSERLLSSRELSLMKSSAILVNAARGRVIDEQALVDALKKQTIAAAGLDVLVYEPPAKDNPLLSLENVLLSPHTAGIYDPVARREQFRTAARWVSEMSGNGIGLTTK